MSITTYTMVECDGASCGAVVTNYDVDAATRLCRVAGARRFARRSWGWSRKLVNSRMGDYCPACTRFLSEIRSR